MLKVIIDPSTKISYSSFYIKGLEDIFGKENISFSSKYFKELKRKVESHSYDHYMAFVLINDKDIKKIIIDFRDKVSIKESAYNWCDTYAKINFNKELTENRFHEKILSIPPGFGIKIWGFWETVLFCFTNLLRCGFSPLVPLKMYLIDYFIPFFRRSNIEDYLDQGKIPSNLPHNEGTKQYVFSISTLWEHKNCIDGTNLLRKKFIELCKTEQKIEFEGGFYANSSQHPQYLEFKEIIFPNRYSIKDYIKKLKLSSFVFNTPAVHNCHGWKLGEFLTMGKAIISTPLSNELPEKLVHGENIHFVTNDSELAESILLLTSDNAYRNKLENGAKVYYSKYVEPKSVIKLILKL